MATVRASKQNHSLALELALHLHSHRCEYTPLTTDVGAVSETIICSWRLKCVTDRCRPGAKITLCVPGKINSSIVCAWWVKAIRLRPQGQHCAHEHMDPLFIHPSLSCTHGRRGAGAYRPIRQISPSPKVMTSTFQVSSRSRMGIRYILEAVLSTQSRGTKTLLLWRQWKTSDHHGVDHNIKIQSWEMWCTVKVHFNTHTPHQKRGGKICSRQ